VRLVLQVERDSEAPGSLRLIGRGASAVAHLRKEVDRLAAVLPSRPFAKKSASDRVRGRDGSKHGVAGGDMIEVHVVGLTGLTADKLRSVEVSLGLVPARAGIGG
jgi:hypothetical protein